MTCACIWGRKEGVTLRPHGNDALAGRLAPEFYSMISPVALRVGNESMLDSTVTETLLPSKV